MILAESLSVLTDQMATKDPTPETMDLLQAVWAKSDAPTRRALLTSLGDAPVAEDVRTWRDDNDLHWTLLRQWRWLAGVAEELEGAWKASYELLVREFGEGDADVRTSGVVTGFLARVTPLASGEIASLGPEGFSEWLRTWTPPTTGWNVPTPAALAAEMTLAVSTSPDAWISALPGLVESLRHPTYVRGVLAGIREAIKDTAFQADWDPIVATAELVTSEPWPVAMLTDDDFDSDRDWAGCHRETLQMFQEALDRDTAFDPDLLQRIWTVLQALTRKRGSDGGLSGVDLLTLAINKLSTIALRTMFGLTLSMWRRNQPLDPWGERLSQAVVEGLQVGGNEASLAGAVAASLFPQFLHVSGPRAAEMVPTIFGEPIPYAVSAGAIGTLVKYARPITNEMLELFAPYLVAHLQGEPADDSADVMREAIRWLVIGYMRQLPGQKNVATLVDRLLRPARISEAAEFYGRVLRDTAEPSAAITDCALLFWDEVLSRPDLDATAFQGFGWWSEGTAIEDESWLVYILATLRRSGGKLDWEDEVVQRLVRLGGESDTWESLALLVRGASDRWTVSYWARHLQDLFEGSQNSDEPIRSLRSELAERLVEQELLDFRRYV